MGVFWNLYSLPNQDSSKTPWRMGWMAMEEARGLSRARRTLAWPARPRTCSNANAACMSIRDWPPFCDAPRSYYYDSLLPIFSRSSESVFIKLGKLFRPEIYTFWKCHSVTSFWVENCIFIFVEDNYNMVFLVVGILVMKRGDPRGGDSV